jgi:alkylhydroperoxidase family enzyme
VPDEVYEEVSEVLEVKQMADLTIAIGLMNAFNRLAISFRAVPHGALSES